MLEKLAAVVLNYRTVEDTVLAVQALRESRRPIDELIVVDNASSDGSGAQLRALLPALTMLTAETNLGYAGGNNLGIREALRRGADGVLLVNSDATVDPDCVGRLTDALSSHPEAGIAGPMLLAADNPDAVTSVGIRFSPVSGRVLMEGFGARRTTFVSAPRTVDAVSGAVMMIRREVLERLGLLDEAYFFSFEDVDFCVRARAAGFATICVLGATARHAGSRTIGPRSPRRLYFATRNHLRMASRVAPAPRWERRIARTVAIVTLNLTYAALRSEAPRLPALAAVIRGAWDHARRRYGEGSADRIRVAGAVPHRRLPP